MDKLVATYDAKSKFSELIRRVGSGEEFIITKNGKKVAELKQYKSVSERKRACMKKYFGKMDSNFNEEIADFSEYK